MEVEKMFPTEVVELPSQGKLYSADSPLSSGKVEMYYMTAKSEDILTNQNYIEKGTVVDKLLQSLIVDKNIKYSDLLIGDKNALLLAARIMGYGKEYEFTYRGVKETVDLSKLPAKQLSKEFEAAKENSFKFVCPASGHLLTFKLLTHGDEQLIAQEIRGYQKLQKDSTPELTTRLKYMITSVNGNDDVKFIREFVDRMFLARDTREFRKFVNSVQPDVDMTFYPESNPEVGVQVPITVGFLWPDVDI